MTFAQLLVNDVMMTGHPPASNKKKTQNDI